MCVHVCACVCVRALAPDISAHIWIATGPYLKSKTSARYRVNVYGYEMHFQALSATSQRHLVSLDFCSPISSPRLLRSLRIGHLSKNNFCCLSYIVLKV